MRDITRHVGTLEIVDRLPQSRNGNPRRSWFAGCAVTVSDVPTGMWDYEQTKVKA